jgi:hypothetical protein
MGNGAIIVMVFILSLFFTSLSLSYFNTEFNGDTSVRTFTLPSNLDSYYGAQNFKNGSYNTSIVDIHGFYNNWEFKENIGMVHTSIGALNTNYLYLDNIQPAGNTITNYYTVNNSIQQDYTIVLRGTGSTDHNEIIVKEDGLHIPDYWQAFGIITGDAYFVSVPNANKIQRVTIKTTYYIGDENNNPSGTITFNGVTYNLQNLHAKLDIPFTMKTYFGGISSSSIGTTLETFRSDNVIAEPTGGSITNTLQMVSSFISFSLDMLIYRLPESVLPMWAQILIIIPQEFMILVGIAMFVREGN